MSDNTNYQGNQTGETKADLSSAALSAWEAQRVVKLRVGLDIHAPSAEQQKKMEADAALQQNQFYVSDWKIQRNMDGTIANLKTGGDKVVWVRKDDLGDNTVGYSFRRHLGKAATNGEVVSEDRMVIHQKPNELGSGGFAGMDDSMMWDTTKAMPMTYLRELVTYSPDQNVASSKALQYLNKNESEHQFLVAKLIKLNQILGLKGKATMGAEFQEPSQAALPQIPVGGYYTNLAGTYVKPIHVPVASQHYDGYANGRPDQVQVAQQQYNGYANGRPDQVQVAQQQYNGYANGRPDQVPVAQQQYNGYANGRPDQVPVTQQRYGGYANGRPITIPIWNGGRNTNDGSRYNHIPVFGGRNTHDGSSYMHIPMNGGGNDNAFRKPSRPIQRRPEPIKEAPVVTQPKNEVPAPVQYVPVKEPVKYVPVQKPVTGHGEGESGSTTDAKVHGEVLPFKKKEQ